MSKENMSPESLMMTLGYNPERFEGSIKTPIFQTSTFVLKSAEDGKRLFEVLTDKKPLSEGETNGLIYSRLNNPNLEILETRLTAYEKGAEDAVVFESGMAAISTTMLEFMRPGEVVLHSNPLYAGTDSLIKNILSRYNIDSLGFMPSDTEEKILSKIEATGVKDRISVIYVETPANPNNILIDIKMCVTIAEKLSTSDRKVYVIADNTYMGPIWQHPLDLGCDMVVYSATKYLGGHSDIVAGACLGRKTEMSRVKKMRSMLGGMSGPHTAWLMLRSLETLKLRMDAQCEGAKIVAKYLRSHPLVEKVYYFDLFENAEQERIYMSQCSQPGAMISFDIKGGEMECFAFLNKLKLIKLAVSLGSTESLIQHPYTMTHAGVSEEVKAQFNITDKLIRLSIGIENPKDLIVDIEQAFD